MRPMRIDGRRRFLRDIDHAHALDRAAHGALKQLGVQLVGPVRGAALRLRQVQAQGPRTRRAETT